MNTTPTKQTYFKHTFANGYTVIHTPGKELCYTLDATEMYGGRKFVIEAAFDDDGHLEEIWVNTEDSYCDDDEEDHNVLVNAWSEENDDCWEVEKKVREFIRDFFSDKEEGDQ